MADTPPPMAFDTSFATDADAPAEAAPGVTRLTAPNGGPFTFTGTNSFIIGNDSVAILDPGPDIAAHREALRRAVNGRKVEAILLTHTHRDHSGGVPALLREIRAPLWFSGPHRLSRPLRPFEVNVLGRDCDWSLTPDRMLFDGESIEVGGVQLIAIATPGHCFNHMSYGLADTPWLLTGDHIMGWNSTLVATPDGSMAGYLASLNKILALPYRRYLPAHGGPIEDGPGYARALLQHRQLRNRQIVDLVSKGTRTIGALLDNVYPTQKGALRFAARLTLKAHLEYLEAEGQLRLSRGLFGTQVLPA